MCVCHICEESDFDVVFKSNRFTWIRCKICRCLCLDPSSVGEVVQQEEITKNEIRRIKQKLHVTMRRSRKRIRDIQRRVKVKDAEIKLLDIGSKLGCLVEAARRLGIYSAGIDINETLYLTAKKIYPECDFRCATINTAGFRSNSFDIIHSANVIEHLSDPNVFLRGIHLHLKPGGLLYLTTEKAISFVGVKKYKQLSKLGIPAYSLFFSENNIVKMLKKHKFDSIKVLFSCRPGIKVIAKKMAI